MPSGRSLAEAADMADRERFGGGVHGEIGKGNAVDLARGHDRPRCGAVERHGQFRLPPQQRQRRDHQPGAIGGQHGEREFDRVRQLNRDHGIRRQSGLDEMRGDRRDRAVGLRVGQALARLAGDALLVEGIDQRQCIGLARQYPFEQAIKRWRSGRLGQGFNFGCITSVAVRPSATRFPAGSPTTRWSLAVLSDSSARSIARRH